MEAEKKAEDERDPYVWARNYDFTLVWTYRSCLVAIL